MTKTDELEGSAAPLMEHLKELRTRIMVSIASFVVAFFVCYLLWQSVFAVLSRPMCNALAARHQECEFVLIKVQEGFFVTLKIAMWGGFVLAFPVIAFQMWRFVAPGLYRNEKRAFLPFLLASPIMFVLGGMFAYFIVLPYAFNFFLTFQDGFKDAMQSANPLAEVPKGVVFQGSVEAFFALTMQFLLAFGLCFQLPVLLTLMGRAGLIGSKGLKSTRKYAVVGILVLSSMIAPPDVTSMMILFAAIYPLYEVSIWIIVYFEKQAEKQAKLDGTWEEPDDE
ncbi:twin-arginine translocase subunit TatC [bacterium]|nr:twin-arginine translocase subunit TatC [bacterium]